MHKIIKLMVACAVAAPMLPCMADTIEHTSITTTKGSDEVVEVKKGVKFKFRERLHNLHAQIDTAVAKNWISAAQAAGFRAEADRLVKETSSTEAAGWPQASVDRLEKSVTKLNADLSTASTAKN